MVGSSHRTLIEHCAGPTGIAIEGGMEGTTGRVVGAQDAMIYGAFAHGTTGDMTFFVKLKLISAYDIIGESASIDRCHEFDVLFNDLWYGRDRWITAISKECVRLTSGSLQSFNNREGLAYVRAGLHHALHSR